jgi:hypothetical protein
MVLAATFARHRAMISSRFSVMNSYSMLFWFYGSCKLDAEHSIQTARSSQKLEVASREAARTVMPFRFDEIESLSVDLTPSGSTHVSSY